MSPESHLVILTDLVWFGGGSGLWKGEIKWIELLKAWKKYTRKGYASKEACCMGILCGESKKAKQGKTGK